MRRFLSSLGRVISASFGKYGLLVQVVAILATAFLVLTGSDWVYYEATRSTILFGFVVFAGLAGFLVPVFGLLTLFLFARHQKDARLFSIAYEVAVAEIVALLIAATYKAFTGRLQPNLANGADISHAFQFGILKNGIFWGWPSSHTIVAFAGACIVVLSVRSSAVRVVAILYAILIGFGASVGFHWLSDVVAGALMGILVAYYTHRDFRRATESL